MRFTILFLSLVLASCSSHTKKDWAPKTAETKLDTARNIASDFEKIFECSGRDEDRVLYYVDVLVDQSSNQEYIRVKKQGESANIFFVTESKDGGDTIKKGYEMDPQTDKKIKGSVASVTIPRVLQNEGKLVMNKELVRIKCTRSQSGGYHTN